MFGQYLRLTHRFEGVLTGKALEFGGSHLRPEATGYGVGYMMQDMLAHRGDSVDGKTCLVSGAGNVSIFCVEKLTRLGGKVITMSDSGGFIHDPSGITPEKLAWIVDLKERRRGRIEEYAAEFGCDFHANARPWHVAGQLAFPCATQNEINASDARALVGNGCMAIAEGANMPSEPAALKVFQQARILLAPSKAANAGGVAVSGLEMSQNSLRFGWTKQEVDERLRAIIRRIHDQCVEYGAEDGHVNYLRGANVAGFVKVADAMLAYGVL
jgi:glutamate dehydrogenase (NADP+)